MNKNDFLKKFPNCHICGNKWNFKINKDNIFEEFNQNIFCKKCKNNNFSYSTTFYIDGSLSHIDIYYEYNIIQFDYNFNYSNIYMTIYDFSLKKLYSGLFKEEIKNIFDKNHISNYINTLIAFS